MNANKVILNGEVILDLTKDNTEESVVGKGILFHKASGKQSVGTAILGQNAVLEYDGTVVITNGNN